MPAIPPSVVGLAYLLAIVLFAFGIKQLGRVRTARSGNRLAALAMLIAVVVTLLHMRVVNYEYIIAGIVIGGLIGAIAAVRVPMTDMPEMVALFNGSGGAASFLVALAVIAPAVWPSDATRTQWVPDQDMTMADVRFLSAPRLLDAGDVRPADQPALVEPPPEPEPEGQGGPDTALTLLLSIIIGGVTLTGSLVAYGKLAGRLSGDAVTFLGQHPLNLLLGVGMLALAGFVAFGVTSPSLAGWLVPAVAGLALLLGVLLVIPIGGADMPVVISLLNSYSGIAASMTGFVLDMPVLIVSGALVGAAGLILTNIMCKAMNRSLVNVLLGGFGATAGVVDKKGARDYKDVKSTTGEELAMMLDGVSSVLFVPGYGLAVAQAQHVTRELGDLLEARGAVVRYAIHPVAGRMPGHMNVLLAEANVPYEKLVEMEDINPEFKTTDVVIVLGANDVVNPAALDEPDSPLAGMPILLVHEARNVVVVKRSLSPGYAGVKNKLFERDNTVMLFADAKEALQETINELKAN